MSRPSQQHNTATWSCAGNGLQLGLVHVLHGSLVLSSSTARFPTSNIISISSQQH